MRVTFAGGEQFADRNVGGQDKRDHLTCLRGSAWHVDSGDETERFLTAADHRRRSGSELDAGFA